MEETEKNSQPKNQQGSQAFAQSAENFVFSLKMEEKKNIINETKRISIKHFMKKQ